LPTPQSLLLPYNFPNRADPRKRSGEKEITSSGESLIIAIWLASKGLLSKYSVASSLQFWDCLNLYVKSRREKEGEL
jgi:hypothetical protein